MSHHVFMSYSRKDVDVMKRVCGLLRDGGLSVWTDENLEPGTENWKDAIQTALEEARSIVVILSPDSKKSQWVKRELDYASTLNLRIFPVLARGNARDAVPFLLASAEYADISKSFEQGIQSLRHAIHSFVGAPLETKTKSPPAEPPPTALPSDQQLVLVPAPARLIRLKQRAPIVFLIGMIAVFGASDPAFLSYVNIVRIMSSASVYGIVAIGMTCVVMSGGIDLSVGAVIGLAGYVAAEVSILGGGLVGSVLSAVGVGLLIGIVQGYFILRLRRASVSQVDTQTATAGLIPALLVTLAGQYLLNPLLLALSSGRSLFELEPALSNIGIIKVVGIPLTVIIFLLSALAGQYILSFTPLGKQLVLIRTDRQAAHRKGIRVNRLVLGCYVTTSCLAGIAGMLQIARLGAATPNLGQGYELTIIGAVLIGGTNLFSPGGSVLRSILGLLVLEVLQNGLAIVGISAFWTQLFIIAPIILFVALDFLTIPRPALVRISPAVGS